MKVVKRSTTLKKVDTSCKNVIQVEYFTVKVWTINEESAENLTDTRMYFILMVTNSNAEDMF